MARQLYFSAWPTDVCGFIYNAVGNLHRGTDSAHSIATLHYLLRNNLMEDAKSWYRNWKQHIPARELSHDQLMLLDQEYRVKHQAKEQVLNMIDGDQIGTLLVTVLSKLMAGVTEHEPEPERNHHPRAKATVG